MQRCLAGALIVDRTVILVTHSLDLVLPLCSYLVHIDSGRIVSAGAPQSVLPEIMDPAELTPPDYETAAVRDNRQEIRTNGKSSLVDVPLVTVESQRKGTSTHSHGWTRPTHRPPSPQGRCHYSSTCEYNLMVHTIMLRATLGTT